MLQVLCGKCHGPMKLLRMLSDDVSMACYNAAQQVRLEHPS